MSEMDISITPLRTVAYCRVLLPLSTRLVHLLTPTPKTRTVPTFIRDSTSSTIMHN